MKHTALSTQGVPTRAGLGKSTMDVAVGCVAAALITVLGALLYAACIAWFRAPETGIAIFTPIVKAVASLVGGFMAARRHDGRGWLRGLSCGTSFTLLAHIVYWIADGQFASGLVLLFDMLLAGAAGSLGGIVAVNLRRH